MNPEAAEGDAARSLWTSPRTQFPQLSDQLPKNYPPAPALPRPWMLRIQDRPSLPASKGPDLSTLLRCEVHTAVFILIAVRLFRSK